MRNPMMKTALRWLTIGLVLAVGIVAALLPYNAGQITVRLLILVTLGLSALADRLAPTPADERSKWTGTAVEIASLTSVLLCGVVMYLVFFTSPQTAHRSALLFAATGATALTVALTELLERRARSGSPSADKPNPASPAP